MTVSSSISLPVNVSQRFRMTEIVRITERQIEGIRSLLVGLRHLETRPKREILSPSAPIGVRLHFFPAADINFLTNRRRILWTVECLITEVGQRNTLLVNEWFNQFDALCD